MLDTESKRRKEQQKQKVKKRYNVTIDPENYMFIPAKKQTDYYDNDVNQRVAIYVRVSTDDVRQTTSYELQKKYYEEFVTRHPNWTLVKIYADEGISGTSLKKRDEFNRMIADCRAGKIDMIITKSVSRFARNVEDFIGTVRNLAELKPRVGVFFESEAIFSLNDDSQMALTFQATMAEEESHTRSRSMETSLRMRLDHGIPLTPKLFGYTHDEEGELQVNPEEAPTVKLMFYMYLYGYSTQQIADTLIAQERLSYFGKLCWTASGVASVLRNERHCGDVLTRKTYTENYRTHRTLKNCGEKPQSWYFNHHTAIVSRDDFNAVQRMLDNAKYGNKSILPELRVIDSGVLKGFVTINPRWAGFKEADYMNAAQSVYIEDDDVPSESQEPEEMTIQVEAGDFDLRGFEITRTEFFGGYTYPTVTFQDRKIKFSTECIKKFGAKNFVELLINPVEMKFAVRPTDASNRNGVLISKTCGGRPKPRDIPSAAFSDTVFSLFGWNTECKYRMTGFLFEGEGELAYIFDAKDSEAFFKSYVLPTKESGEGGASSVQPLTPSGKHIRAIPAQWTHTFGKEFYLHEQPFSSLASMTKSDWELRIKGQLFETGKKLNVTGFDELKQYITRELGGVMPQEVSNGYLE